MTKKTVIILEIIIAIMVIVIVLLCISIPQYYRRIELLENRNDTLEFQLSAANRELKIKSDKLTGSYQEIENLYINNQANGMYINYIEKRMFGLIDYVVYVNLILKANNIEIPKWVDKYVDGNEFVKDGIGGE